jgi:hypothetical protein
MSQMTQLSTYWAFSSWSMPSKGIDENLAHEGGENLGDESSRLGDEREPVDGFMAFDEAGAGER